MSDVQEAQQQPKTAQLCASVTGTGGQTGVAVDGYDGTTKFEAIAVGTIAAQAVTYTLEGSDDNTNWYTVAIEQIDATASPAYAVTGVTLTPGNGTVRHEYLVRDRYAYLRINPSANTLAGTGAGLTVNYRALPV